MKNKKFLCMDCQVDISKIGEHYFIKTDLWLSVVSSNKGMLCIGCLEKRIGRLLTKADFTDCYINNPKFSGMSKRLLNRLA
jgi:hypothetical protein